MSASSTVAPSADYSTLPLVMKLDIAEVEGNKRFIAGYANIAGIIDSQNEIVTIEALKKAWERWKANPDYALLQLVHGNIPLAKVVFEPVVDSKGNTHQSGVDAKGLYIVGLVRDDVKTADEVWQDIEMGKTRGFSIGGRNLDPQPVECDADRCYSYITDLELYEVSIVPNPANRVSLFNVLKCEPEMQEEIFKLSQAVGDFNETVLIEGILQISKTPNEEGKYELHSCADRGSQLCKELSLYLAEKENLMDRFIIVDELDPEKEYVKFMDVSLLRPLSLEGLTGRDGHVGSNPPSDIDKPQEGEESPLPEGKQEVEKEQEESLESESPEPPEAQPVEEKQEEEAPAEEEEKQEEEAIVPITLEVLVAELALLNERIGKFSEQNELLKPFADYKNFADCVQRNKDKNDPKAYCGKIKHQVEDSKKVEKSAEPEVPAEAPAETPAEAPAEAPVEPPAEQPVEQPAEVETPPETPSEPSSQDTGSTPESESPPAVETPVPAAEPVVETRGQYVAPSEPKDGLDLEGVYRLVSWKDLENLDKR